jgi:hypothetical protein
MPVLVMNCMGWRWKGGIGEGAHCHPDDIWFALRLPAHRRSTVRTKMEADSKPAIGPASICAKLALLFHIPTREKRGDTVGAAGALLAL